MNRLLLLLSLLSSIFASAPPLKREEITAILADPVSYDNVTLRTVLLDAKKLAA